MGRIEKDMKFAILHTGIRADEKLIIEKVREQKSVELELIDARKLILGQNDEYFQKFDVILERCISSLRGNIAIDYLTNIGVNIVNNSKIASICNDKFQTATILKNEGVPHVKSILVFDEEGAKQAVDEMGGYPVVLKSREGSWGRLISKLNDDDALEGLVDHRKYMGLQHQAFLIQEYVEKPGRDIRVFAIDGEAIAAIYRTTEHWITNTARGAVATNCPITDEISDICRKSSQAIGGGLLAFDLFETSSGLIVNEINHTMEFKNSEAPTGVSISGRIVEYCLKSALKAER